MASCRVSKVNSTWVSVSSPPVQPISGSISGGVRRSKHSTHFLVRASPEAITERDGRWMRATAPSGQIAWPTRGARGGRLWFGRIAVSIMVTPPLNGFSTALVHALLASEHFWPVKSPLRPSADRRQGGAILARSQGIIVGQSFDHDVDA